MICNVPSSPLLDTASAPNMNTHSSRFDRVISNQPIGLPTMRTCHFGKVDGVPRVVYLRLGEPYAASPAIRLREPSALYRRIAVLCQRVEACLAYGFAQLVQFTTSCFRYVVVIAAFTVSTAARFNALEGVRASITIATAFVTDFIFWNVAHAVAPSIVGLSRAAVISGIVSIFSLKISTIGFGNLTMVCLCSPVCHNPIHDE